MHSRATEKNGHNFNPTSCKQRLEEKNISNYLGNFMHPTCLQRHSSIILCNLIQCNRLINPFGHFFSRGILKAARSLSLAAATDDSSSSLPIHAGMSSSSSNSFISDDSSTSGHGGSSSSPKSFPRFTWLASDGWGKQAQVVAGIEDFAVGAITVELESKKITGSGQEIILCLFLIVRCVHWLNINQNGLPAIQNLPEINSKVWEQKKGPGWILHRWLSLSTSRQICCTSHACSRTN